MNYFKEISRTLIVGICIALAASIAACALIFVYGVKSDIYQPPAVQPPEETDKPNDPTLSPTHDYGDIYIDKMIIFCDSALSGIAQYEILRDNSVIITGKNGETPLDFNTHSAETSSPAIDGKARSITDIVSDQKPQYLLISIGLNNGVEHCSEEKFKQYYQKLIDSVTSVVPDTKIILQSVLPVSQSVSKNTPALSIDKIERANQWIHELCTFNSVCYLNTQEILKNEKGYLLGEYDSGDGIHLNEQGYRAVYEYIKTHGYK